MWFIRVLLSVIDCNHISPRFCESSLEEIGPANVGLSLESSFQTDEEAPVKFIVFFMVECRRLVG